MELVAADAEEDLDLDFDDLGAAPAAASAALAAASCASRVASAPLSSGPALSRSVPTNCGMRRETERSEWKCQGEVGSATAGTACMLSVVCPSWACLCVRKARVASTHSDLDLAERHSQQGGQGHAELILHVALRAIVNSIRCGDQRIMRR